MTADTDSSDWWSPHPSLQHYQGGNSPHPLQTPLPLHRNHRLSSKHQLLLQQQNLIQQQNNFPLVKDEEFNFSEELLEDVQNDESDNSDVIDPHSVGISNYCSSDMSAGSSLYLNQFGESVQDSNYAFPRILFQHGLPNSPHRGGRGGKKNHGLFKQSNSPLRITSPRTTLTENVVIDLDGRGDGGEFSESGLSYKKCPICQKRITYNHLKRHIKTQHTDMQRVSCPFCFRLLKNTYSLETHIANYHK